MELALGIDIGQRYEASGLCLAEIQERTVSGRRAEHYVVRVLERIAPDTSFPRIATRVAQVVDNAYESQGSWPEVYVDATGLGDPITSLIQEELGGYEIRTVYFNHGDRRETKDSETIVGKAWLVSHLQKLLQTNRLHLPSTPEASDLVRELLEYRIRLPPDANDRYGAFPVGRHDELVTALGLAVLPPPERPHWEVF